MFYIKQIYKNKSLYITYHQIENGKWRSNKIEDARMFNSEQEAKNFLETKYKFGGNFVIEKREL